jgi:hypothetical protein
MRSLRLTLSLSLSLALPAAAAFAQMPPTPALATTDAASTGPMVPIATAMTVAAKHSTLDQAGNPPWHLKAIIVDLQKHLPEYDGTMEMWWVSPTEWRREVKLNSGAFSQVLIHNGSKVSEIDTDPNCPAKSSSTCPYFPDWMRNLVDETTRPIPRLDQLANATPQQVVQPGGTKGSTVLRWPINGIDPARFIHASFAFYNDTGLIQYGGDLDWDFHYRDYAPFHDLQIARWISAGPPEISVKIDTLEDLGAPDAKMFAISKATPEKDRIKTVIVPEAEMRKLIVSAPAPVWPDVPPPPPARNGRAPRNYALTGSMIMGISVDRMGNVREVYKWEGDNRNLEPAAHEQITKWKFKPYMVNGVPVQVLSTLTFPFSVKQTDAPAAPAAK